MKRQPLLNLVISDTHCGSDVGLTPKHVRLEKGRILSCTGDPYLEWLDSSFTDMQNRFHALRDGAPYILTINGDVIEGIHHRSEEVVAAKFVEHLEIAKAALGPLISQAAATYVTIGTECHTRDFEKVFVKEMKIKQPARHIQHYEVHGCLVEAVHHMPVTSRKHLEASALSIIMANRISNLVRARHSVPRVFIRGHRHITGDYCDGENVILCCGPWQGLTRHGHKVVPDSISRPSAYVLDWRGRDRGDLPARHQFVYTPPEDIL